MQCFCLTWPQPPILTWLIFRKIAKPWRPPFCPPCQNWDAWTQIHSLWCLFRSVYCPRYFTSYHTVTSQDFRSFLFSYHFSELPRVTAYFFLRISYNEFLKSFSYIPNFFYEKFVKLKQDSFCRQFFFVKSTQSATRIVSDKNFFVKSRQEKLANYCG